MGINILGDRVAIRPLADPDKIGSIIVPDVAKGRAVQGVIAMVGPKCVSLKRGDHVFFPAYSGTVVDIEDVRYILMYEKDVSCKLITEPLLVPGLFMEIKGPGEYGEGDSKFVLASEDFIIEMLHIHYEEQYGDLIDKAQLDRKNFKS